MTIALDKVRVVLDGLVVLDNFSIELPERGIVALSGPSGCGKTTFFHALAGLIALDSGHVLGAQGKRFSVIFQEDRLLPWLTVFDNVNLVVRDAEKTKLWLKRMQLIAQKDHLPDQLSGGMKRRVALARALAFDSDVLLLDEPFQGMDDALRAHLYPWIEAAAHTKPVLMITHDYEELTRLGQVVWQADGPPLRIFTHL